MQPRARVISLQKKKKWAQPTFRKDSGKHLEKAMKQIMLK
jgi:hypothetical protein